MTPAEIIATIEADPQMTAWRAERDDVSIAQKLSIGRLKAESTVGGYGTVVAVCGGATMNKLKAIAEAGIDADFTWGYQALMDRCFDFGLAKVIAGWDRLTMLPAAALTQDEADALKAIPMVPDPVTVEQVSAALNGA